MPWKTRSLVAARVEFVQAVRRGLEAFGAVCARCHISRQTGYKWWRRYRSRGWSGLQERSRRPRRLGRAKDPRWAARLRRLHRRNPRLGLRPQARDCHSVWLGPHLLGELHDTDAGGLRQLRQRFPL